jgi:hypothetical protein
MDLGFNRGDYRGGVCVSLRVGAVRDFYVHTHS